MTKTTVLGQGDKDAASASREIASLVRAMQRVFPDEDGAADSSNMD